MRWRRAGPDQTRGDETSENARGPPSSAESAVSPARPPGDPRPHLGQIDISPGGSTTRAENELTGGDFGAVSLEKLDYPAMKRGRTALSRRMHPAGQSHVPPGDKAPGAGTTGGAMSSPRGKPPGQFRTQRQSIYPAMAGWLVSCPGGTVAEAVRSAGRTRASAFASRRGPPPPPDAAREGGREKERSQLGEDEGEPQEVNVHGLSSHSSLH